MKDNWEIFPLGELFDFSSGLSKPRADFGSGFGFLSFKDVFYNYFVPDQLEQLVNSTEKEQKTCSVKRGDVFLTRTSETQEDLGMSCVALKDYDRATFNGFTKRLRPKVPGRIVPEYAGYFFRSKLFRKDVTAMSSLSTRASLNNEMLGRLKMLLPPVEDQKAIGRVLKSFDDKIELNRQMKATLEAMARFLFKAWFVDFEPVRANMENRPAESASPEIAKLFPSEFENGIPKGWVETNFGAIIKENNERNTERRELPVLSAIQSGELVKSAEFFNKQVFSAETAKYKLVKTLSYAFNPSRINIGSIGLNTFEEDGLVSPIYVVFSVKPELAYWLRFHIRSERVKNLINVLATGTVRQNLTYRDFASIPLVLPSIETIKAFNKFLGSIDALRQAKTKEIEKLVEIRDSLLPRLISGKIPVGNIEAEAQGANE